MERAAGIDVSHYHPIRDWAALLATDVQFIGAKATEGRGFVDPWFTRHRDGVRAAGDRLALAFYYHVATNSDPVEQAGHLAAVVGELRTNEQLCLDCERSFAPGPGWVGAFFGALPKRRHQLYTSKSVWELGGGADSVDWAPGVDLWLPRYKSGAKEPNVPGPWRDRGWAIWQWSEDGQVPGVDGPCDLDWFNGDEAALRAYAAGVSSAP